MAADTAATYSREAVALIHLLESQGVIVECKPCDISEHPQVDASLRRYRPVLGLIQAAMVLDDHSLDEMSWSSFDTVLSPKVQGSRNLHVACGEDKSDFFIMLSSLSGAIGMGGQANYAAANTYQDELARSRVQSGLPGTSINLPVIKDTANALVILRISLLIRSNCSEF